MGTVLEAGARQAERTELMIRRDLDLAALVVMAEDEHSIVKVRMLCDSDAAFATGHDLLALQRPCCSIAEGSHSLVVEFCAVCVGAVFD